MKTQAVKNFAMHFVSGNKDYAGKALSTLVHAYPEMGVETFGDAKSACDGNPNIIVIDTDFIGSNALDSELDQVAEIPTILLARDFGSMRFLGKYLSGKTSIITPEDLASMGIIRAVHHMIERQKLQKQLKKASMHLKELTIRDELTGFFNNHHFHDVLSGEVKKANRYKRPLGLVIISVKNISAINKALGHNEGDRVLAKMADTIRGMVRDVDVPARYGDNEFAIVLPESDEDGVKVVAKRIQDIFEDFKLETDGDPIPVIISCGIAALSHRILSKEDLLRTALGALIEAKKNGQNTICTSEEMEARRHIVRENRQLIEQLSERLHRLANEAQRSYFQSLMKAIGEIPMLKRILMSHSERVAFFAKRLAESYGLDDSKAGAIYRAGLLHDTGKLAIDPDILTKPTRLSLAEQELMQKHPLFGVQLIGQNPFLTEELGAILHHHERFDGEGYPERLAGDSIPLPARILAIAEAWDVMTTTQPYRAEPLALDAAISEIQRGAGQQFDPDLVGCFVGLITG